MSSSLKSHRMVNVSYKVYIPGVREFRRFDWIVTTRVARSVELEKYQSRIVVGCLLVLMHDHTPRGGGCVSGHGGIHEQHMTGK